MKNKKRNIAKEAMDNLKNMSPAKRKKFVDAFNKYPYTFSITPEIRLSSIARIIEDVDNRCMAYDGAVGKTLDEMSQEEISAIYALATGKGLTSKKMQQYIQK